MPPEENLSNRISSLFISDQENGTRGYSATIQKYSKVTSANDVEEAIRILSGKNFDLIYFEKTQSDDSFFDALRTLLHNARGIPVITIVDEAESEHGEKSMEAGAEDFIFRNQANSEQILRRVTRYVAELSKMRKKLIQKNSALEVSQGIARLGSWTWYPEIDLFVPTENFLKIFEIDGLKELNSSKGFLRHVAEDDRNKVASAIRKYRNNPGPIDLEFQIITKTGSKKYIYLRGEIVKDHPSSVMYYGTGQDITSLRISTENLRQRERFLQMTGETASLGGWEINLRTQDVFWTKAMFDIHEVDPAFIPSRETAIDFYSPLDRIEIRRMLDDAILNDTSFRYEKKIVFPNGTEKWIFCTGRPVYEDGIPVKMTGIMQDVTESHERIAAMHIRSKMLDNVDEAAIAVSRDWKIIFWNKAAEKLLKYSREEVFGRRPQELDLADISEATLREIVSLLQKGQSYSGEFMMKDKTGRKFPVYASNSAVFDEDGEVVAYLNFSRDISRDKEYIRQIEESEERFRRLFEHSPIGKGLVDIKSGRWLDSNTTLLKLLGYTKEEFLRETIQDLTPPNYREIDKLHIRRALKTGHFGPYRKAFYKKDGTSLQALITGFVMGDPARPKAWSHIVDITELEEKTAALNLIEERFREYIEYASDVFLTTGEDSVITFISHNILNILGYTAEEITGMRIYDLVHPDDQEAMHKVVRNSTDNIELPLKGTFRFQHKSGRYKYIQGQGSMRQKETGEYYSLIIARDMDQERKTELQMREQNAKLRDIAFIQSHIVRRPLSNILGLLDISQMNRNLPETAERIIALIKKEAEVMDQIISEIVEKTTAVNKLSEYDE